MGMASIQTGITILKEKRVSLREFLKKDSFHIMLTLKQQLKKRLFDILTSFFALLLLIIPILIFLTIAGFGTKMPGLFKQSRIGKNGNSFTMYKIRTLKGGNHKNLQEIKHFETGFGRWLRKTKLDELPQLYNVLIGDMSMVGPRPDVSGYADKLQGSDRIILMVRPGITGPATLKYREEEKLLLQQKNSLEYNDTIIWPDKVKINKEYVTNWSFIKDMKYLYASVF
jgi:lipopolysaccharide/colanic/teichoic acid biosynthesis glycosyltransferase